MSKTEFIQLLNTVLANDYNFEEVKKHQNRLYDFVHRDSDKLFITIGDSWTYGYRLDKEGNRVDLCYGNLVSQSMGADYLNLSIPAINNTWMVEKFAQISKITTQYKKVMVLICLTEYGRELNTDFDMDPAVHDMYKQCQSCQDLAIALAKYNSNTIIANLQPHIKLFLATTYVNNFYPPELQKYFLPQSWLDTLAIQKNQKECFVVGSWVIPKYREVLDLYNIGSVNDRISQTTELIDIANARLEAIYDAGYSHREGYRHPNSQGHKVWADYITQFINDSL